MSRTAVLLGGPCDLTRMALPDSFRGDELLMPTIHTVDTTFGYQRNVPVPRHRIQVYKRTWRCFNSNAEVFEWVREDKG